LARAPSELDLFKPSEASQAAGRAYLKRFRHCTEGLDPDVNERVAGAGRSTRQAGGRVEKVAADLRAPTGPHALAKLVHGIVGSRLDILVADAGIAKAGSIGDTTVECRRSRGPSDRAKESSGPFE
jgi:NAD(P)-dependent dehydrogenase (short-subunit alcohol dehydrogenase family)